MNDKFVPWRKSSETTCISHLHLTVLQLVMGIHHFRLKRREVAVSAALAADRPRTIRDCAGCEIIGKMPSPLGHALGGIAAGCAVLPPPDRHKLLLFAAAGLTADLDLILPMTHRGPAHSVTAAVVVFALALLFALWKYPTRSPVRFAAAVGAAYLTHVLLDWLGEDGGPPSGIMALWPFSHEYYVSGLDVFAGVERRYWLPGFWQENLTSMAREIIILAPITLIVIALASRAGRRPRTEVE